MPRRKRKPPRGYHPPPLTVDLILSWADAWFARRGQWPRYTSGPIPESVADKWSTVDSALSKGLRGLPGGTTLARLLAEHRGAPYLRYSTRPTTGRPPLTIDMILACADAHHARTGHWPGAKSGPVLDAPHDETWKAVDSALRLGIRGLPIRLSLAQLLVQERGVRNVHLLPDLKIDQILAWASAHHKRTGNWPNERSGTVEGTEEDWYAIDQSLRRGSRGLQGGSSLPQLLEQHLNVPNRLNRPHLTEQLILAWADAHHARSGRWPRADSGPILDVPGDETWTAITLALSRGTRGLPGGSSLARLLTKHRGR